MMVARPHASWCFFVVVASGHAAVLYGKPKGPAPTFHYSCRRLLSSEPDIYREHEDSTTTQLHPPHEEHSRLISDTENALLSGEVEEEVDEVKDEDLYLFSDASVRLGASVLKGDSEQHPYYYAQLGVAGFRNSYANPLLLKAKPGFRYQRGKTHDTREKWQLQIRDAAGEEFRFPTSDAAKNPLTASVLSTIAEAEAALFAFEQFEEAISPTTALTYVTDSLDLVHSLEMGFLEMRKVRDPDDAMFQPEMTDERCEISLPSVTTEAELQSLVMMTSDHSYRLPPWFPAYKMLRQSGLLSALLERISGLRTRRSFRIIHVRSASVLRRTLSGSSKGTTSGGHSSDAAAGDAEANAGTRELQLRGPFMLGNQLADDFASSFLLAPSPLRLVGSRHLSAVARERGGMRRKVEDEVLDLLASCALPTIFATSVVKRKRAFRATAPASESSPSAFYRDREEIFEDLRTQAKAAFGEVIRLKIAGSILQLSGEDDQLTAYVQSAKKQYDNWKEALGKKYREYKPGVHAGVEVEVEGAARPPVVGNKSNRWTRAFAQGEDDAGSFPEDETEEETAGAGNADAIAESSEPEEVVLESPLDRFRRWAGPLLPKVPLPQMPFHRLDESSPPRSADVEAGFGDSASTTKEFLRQFRSYERGLKTAFLLGQEGAPAGQVQIQQLARCWARLRVLRARVLPWVVDTEQRLKSLSTFLKGPYRKLLLQYAKEATLRAKDLPPVSDPRAAPGLGLVVRQWLQERSTDENGLPLTAAMKNAYATQELQNPETAKLLVGEMKQNLEEDLETAATQFSFVVPVGLSDGVQYEELALQFGKELRKTALQAVLGALRPVEEVFLALVERLFAGGGEGDFPEGPRRSRSEESSSSHEDVVAHLEFLDDERDEEAGQQDREVQGDSRERGEREVDGMEMDLDLTPSSSSQGEPNPKGAAAKTLGLFVTVLHKMQFSAMLNDLANVNSIARREYDHLRKNAPNLLAYTAQAQDGAIVGGHQGEAKGQGQGPQTQEKQQQVLQRPPAGSQLPDKGKAKKKKKDKVKDLVLELDKQKHTPSSSSARPSPSFDGIMRKPAADFFSEALFLTGAGGRKFRMSVHERAMPMPSSRGGRSSSQQGDHDHGDVEQSWMTFHSKMQRAGRVAAGAADVFPDMQAARELVQRKGSPATAVAALVLTPWEAARLLSVSSVGGEERDVGVELPNLVVSVRDEVAREQRELVAQKKAAVALPSKRSAQLDGILEPLLSESADAAAIMRAKAENKYGNALYSFTRTLYPGHLFAEAKRNIETLKTQLVELFFKLADQAPQMLVSCPEEDTSGRSSTPEVDAALHRVQIEYLVREFVSAVFLEQAAVVARPELAELSAAFPKKIADVEQRDQSPQLLLELAVTAWRRPQAWVGEAVAESLAATEAAKEIGDEEEYAEKCGILGNQLRELGKAAFLAHMEHAQRSLWKEVGLSLQLANNEKQRLRSVALLARGNAVGSGRGGGRGGKKVPRKLLKGAPAARALGLLVESDTAPEDVELGGGEPEAEGEAAAASDGAARRCLEARALWEKMVLDVLNRKVHQQSTASHVEMLFPLLGRALMDGGVYVPLAGGGGEDGVGVGHSPLNVPDGELQFAPPKNEDPAKIDADITGLGINVWRMDGEDNRVAVLARLQRPETFIFSETRGDEQMNPRASTSSWLVVKVDDRDFQAAFRRELERAITPASQQTFKSGAHMRATVATQVALRNGFWHVARTEELETAPMTLFVGGEDLESN